MEKSEKAKQLRALRKYGKKVGRTTDRDGMGPRVFVRRLPGLSWFCCLVCVPLCVYSLIAGWAASVHKHNPSWTPIVTRSSMVTTSESGTSLGCTLHTCTVKSWVQISGFQT